MDSKFNDLMSYLHSHDNCDDNHNEQNDTINLNNDLGNYPIGITRRSITSLRRQSNNNNLNADGSDQKKSVFIWDELDNHDTYNNDTVINGNSNSHINVQETINRIKASSTQRSQPTSSSTNIQILNTEISTPSFSNESIIQTINEMKDKLKNLKNDIDTKSNHIKDLHQELIRIENARLKRLEKCTNKWENQYNTLKKEHNDIIKQQQDIYQKLIVDLKELNQKKKALIERQNQFKMNEQFILEKAKQDWNRKLIRQKNQWENEEKTYFETVATKKIDSMKKAAVTQLAPKLDKLVADNRIAIQEKTNTLKIQLNALKNKLQHEYEQSIYEEQERCRRQHHQELENMHREHKGQLDTIRQKHKESIQLLYEKNMHHIQEIESQWDELRKKDTRIHTEQLQELKQQEITQLTNIKSNHQKELNDLLNQNQYQLIQYKEYIAQDIDKVRKEQQRGAVLETQKLLQQFRLEIQKQYQEEKDQIISKVKDELSQELKQKQLQLQEEYKQLQASIVSRIKILQEKEKKSSESLSNVTQEINEVEYASNQLPLTLQSLQTSLTTLDNEYITYKSDYDTKNREYQQYIQQYDLLTQNKNKSKSSPNYSNVSHTVEGSHLSKKEVDLRDELSELEEKMKNDLNDIDMKNKEEKDRVENKINLLYTKRETAIEKLKQQLIVKQNEYQQLNDVLNELRTNKFLNT